MVPALQVIDGFWLSVTFTVNEQVQLCEPLVAFHVTVVNPLFNCTPEREVPVPDVAPLKVYDNVGVPQAHVAVALNSFPETVYLHDAPAFFVHELTKGHLITGVPDPTVIDFVATAEPQLLVTVYLMVTGPAYIPLTTPPEVTVAIEVLELLQPPIALLPLMVSVIVEPTQTVDKPLIVPALGAGLMVTVKLQVLVLPQASLAV